MADKIIKISFNVVIFAFFLYLSWWAYQHGHFDRVLDLGLPFKILFAFLGGVLYTSFFTAPIALALLIVLAQVVDPLLVAGVAGAGSVLGDLTMIKFFRFIFNQFKVLTHDHKWVSEKIGNLLHTLRLNPLAYVVGALIIALPLPDEIGLLLIGASRLSYIKLAVLTYVLNTTGILMILLPLSTYK